jgi:hypothetical protein
MRLQAIEPAATVIKELATLPAKFVSMSGGESLPRSRADQCQKRRQGSDRNICVIHQMFF